MLKNGIRAFVECLAGIFRRETRKKSKVNSHKSIEMTAFERRDTSWWHHNQLRIKYATKIQQVWRRFLCRKRCREIISERYRLAGVERALTNKYDFDIIWSGKTARRRWKRRSTIGSSSLRLPNHEQSDDISQGSTSSDLSPNSLPRPYELSKSEREISSAPFICSICLDRGHASMTSSIQVITRCKHRFHYNCLQEYMSFKRNEMPKCPYCRQDIHLKSPFLNKLNQAHSASSLD